MPLREEKKTNKKTTNYAELGSFMSGSGYSWMTANKTSSASALTYFKHFIPPRRQNTQSVYCGTLSHYQSKPDEGTGASERIMLTIFRITPSGVSHGVWRVAMDNGGAIWKRKRSCASKTFQYESPKLHPVRSF